MASISSRLNLQAISAATDTEPVVSDRQDLKKYLKSHPPPPTPPPSTSLLHSEHDFPPPGFNPPTSTISKPPGFNNSPPQSTTPTSLSSYIKPDDYDKRNQLLSTKLANLFGIYNEEEFTSFKEFSLQFQQSRVTGKEYLAKCTKILDFQTDLADFYDLVQEMIVLLPDAQKQHELYTAFAKVVETSDKAKANRPTGRAKLANRLVECRFCEQYFLNSELNLHQSAYHKKEAAALYAESARAAVVSEAPVKTNNKEMAPVVPAKKPQSHQTKPVSEEFPSLMSTVKVEPPKNQS